jgi:WD40 repeat protein
MAVTRDGKTVVVSGEKGPNRVRIFDVDKQQQVAVFDTGSEQQRNVLVSADNTWLACYADGGAEVELRDLKTGGPARVLKPEGDDLLLLQCVVFSPRSDLIFAASFGEVLGWECKSGRQRVHWQAHKSSVVGLGALPDGRLVTTSRSDKTMKIWDPAAGNPVKMIALEGDVGLQLALSPDGKLAASMEEKKLPGQLPRAGATIFVWNLENGTRVSQMRRELLGDTWIMQFLADNKHLVIHASLYLGFWDAVAGANKLTAQGESPRDRVDAKAVSAVAVVEGGTLFILREDGTLQRWEVKE